MASSSKRMRAIDTLKHQLLQGLAHTQVTFVVQQCRRLSLSSYLSLHTEGEVLSLVTFNENMIICFIDIEEIVINCARVVGNQRNKRNRDITRFIHFYVID